MDAKNRAETLMHYSEKQNSRWASSCPDGVDFLIRGEPAGLLFRKREPTVYGDLEYAARSRHQLDLGTVFSFQ